jgi:hypothetical protein
MFSPYHAILNQLDHPAVTPGISAGHWHPIHAEVLQTWPEDTDLRSTRNGKIRLTDQTPIV